MSIANTCDVYGNCIVIYDTNNKLCAMCDTKYSKLSRILNRPWNATLQIGRCKVHGHPQYCYWLCLCVIRIDVTCTYRGFGKGCHLSIFSKCHILRRMRSWSAKTICFWLYLIISHPGDQLLVLPTIPANCSSTESSSETSFPCFFSLLFFPSKRGFPGDLFGVHVQRISSA